MTPTEELRATAVALRKMAQEATPGPWEGVVDDHGGGEINASVWADSIGYYITETISSGPRHEADARWIGLMSPEIAEGIALLLDEAALRRDRGEGIQAHAENLAAQIMEAAK